MIKSMHTMESNPDNEHSAQQILDQLLAGISTMERAMYESNERTQKYMLEIDSLKAELRAQTESHKKLRHDYESLRIQKGGFGFKALAASLLSGLIAGLLLFWVYTRLQPKDENIQAFERFRHENLFSYELAISQGRTEDVESALHIGENRPENALIKPELEFARKLLSASRRYCDEKKPAPPISE